MTNYGNCMAYSSITYDTYFQSNVLNIETFFIYFGILLNKIDLLNSNLNKINRNKFLKYLSEILSHINFIFNMKLSNNDIMGQYDAYIDMGINKYSELGYIFSIDNNIFNSTQETIETFLSNYLSINVDS